MTGRWRPSSKSWPTRSSLLRLLGGDRTPALLFFAAHGLGFAPDDDRQRAEQGALGSLRLAVGPADDASHVCRRARCR